MIAFIRFEFFASDSAHLTQGNMSTGDYVFPYVFVLGRPGSGKSELYTQAAKILSERKKDYIRLDDVRELRKLIVSDKEHKYVHSVWCTFLIAFCCRFVKPTADGSFTVVNPSVFDVVLKTVHQQALEHRVCYNDRDADARLSRVRALHEHHAWHVCCNVHDYCKNLQTSHDDTRTPLIFAPT